MTLSAVKDSEDKLKPCPFCGGDAGIKWGGFGEYCYVICENCGANGACADAEAKAKHMWNERDNHGVTTA